MSTSETRTEMYIILGAVSTALIALGVCYKRHLHNKRLKCLCNFEEEECQMGVLFQKSQPVPIQEPQTVKPQEPNLEHL